MSKIKSKNKEVVRRLSETEKLPLKPAGTITIIGVNGVGHQTYSVAGARAEMMDGDPGCYAELLGILVHAHEAAQRVFSDDLDTVVLRFGGRPPEEIEA